MSNSKYYTSSIIEVEITNVVSIFGTETAWIWNQDDQTLWVYVNGQRHKGYPVSSLEEAYTTAYRQSSEY